MTDAPARVEAVVDSIVDDRFLTKQIETADGPRMYKLYVPSSYDKSRPAPLLVVLHGCTQNPDDVAKGTRFNALAEEKGMLVAYPEQPQKYNGLKCWNWFDSSHQVRGKGEPALIASITERVLNDYPIDARRVYIAGLSAGGAMAINVAYAYPELFAAAGIHSGIAYGSATSIATALNAMHTGAADPSKLADAVTTALGSARHFPAIVFQGRADKSVNFVNADQIVSQLSALYQPKALSLLSEKSSDSNGYHSITRIYGNGRPLVEEWMVEELGHAWSGGSKDGTYTDEHGPDAAREMIRFFFEHPRDR